MQARNYVTISQRRNGWRVAAKAFSGNLNSLDSTLAEALCRTEQSAKRQAKAYADRYDAEILD